MPPFKNKSVRLFDFHFPHLDNHLRVEVCDEQVTVRATRNNFTERRKHFFIRELAAEGYIDDSFQWRADWMDGDFGGVNWIIDRSWVKLDPRQIRRTNRFMLRLFLALGLAWVAMITLVLIRGH